MYESVRARLKEMEIRLNIRKVHAYLAVTCHLHFWQHDRDLLHDTAVTRG